MTAGSPHTEFGESFDTVGFGLGVRVWGRGFAVRSTSSEYGIDAISCTRQSAQTLFFLVDLVTQIQDPVYRLFR
jgi:hypothetical protein